MALYKGSEVVAGLSKNTIVTGFNVFDFRWSDHLINDIQWLRSDTFSWQSGDVYVTAYNKLVEEYSTGTTETEGGITFKRTTNGFKIATSDMESAILNKYNVDGIAWYYILDTANKRFKLPRTKWGFKGLRTNAGDDIAESLPNIRGTIDGFVNAYGPISTRTNAFKDTILPNKTKAATSGGSNWTEYPTLDFNANNSSSTYQDNAPVQERATQMYLYFYVGEYAREAIEQTAGLNSEMFNGKQDVCTHITSTYINGTSGYRIWSDGYCEQWGLSDYGSLSNSPAFTVQYIKTMRDTNYTINICPIRGEIGYYKLAIGVETMTTNRMTFGFYGNDTTRYGSWKVCGYLAEGEY